MLSSGGGHREAREKKRGTSLARIPARLAGFLDGVLGIELSWRRQKPLGRVRKKRREKGTIFIADWCADSSKSSARPD